MRVLKKQKRSNDFLSHAESLTMVFADGEIQAFVGVGATDRPAEFGGDGSALFTIEEFSKA